MVLYSQPKEKEGYRVFFQSLSFFHIVLLVKQLLKPAEPVEAPGAPRFAKNNGWVMVRVRVRVRDRGLR